MVLQTMEGSLVRQQHAWTLLANNLSNAMALETANPDGRAHVVGANEGRDTTRRETMRRKQHHRVAASNICSGGYVRIIIVDARAYRI